MKFDAFVTSSGPADVIATVSEATKGTESMVAITFEARGDQTEVTLHHSGIPDDELGRSHRDGWTGMLSELAERFGSKK